MKNILLIGGAGFLGLNVAASLIRGGFNVFLMDRRCQHLRSDRNLMGVSGFYDGDAANMEAILTLVDSCEIECVVNLASALIPSSGLQDFSSEMALCTLPAFRLIPELAARRIKYVFFSSGGAIYGRAGDELMSEVNHCQPVSLYGYGKLIFEDYIELCGRSNSLDYLIIRPSNPYGRYQNPMKMQGFIAVAMHKLLKNEEIEIWGDGSVTRDYILVDDMVNAFTSLLSRNAWNNVFNIGSSIGYSLLEVLKVMEHVTGKQARIVYKASRSVDVSKIILDISKLKSEVDFQPKSLLDGMKIYYEKMIDVVD